MQEDRCGRGLPWVPAMSVEDCKMTKATKSWFAFCDHLRWAVLNHVGDKILLSQKLFLLVYILND